MQIQSAQEFIWRRVEDNRVRNPEANCWLAFRGVKDTLLFLEPKERKEECGGKAPLRARMTLPSTQELWFIYQSVLHTDSSTSC